MDIVDRLLKTHGEMRESLDFLADLLRTPRGVGLDEQSALDGHLYLRALGDFLAVFTAHEAMEDEFFSQVARHFAIESDLTAIIAQGHYALGDLAQLFAAAVGGYDGAHAQGVRIALYRLREELENHLAYEEKKVFPRIRARLPAVLLREFGRRAAARNGATRAVLEIEKKLGGGS